jgi:hypothetical protein
MLAGRTKGDEGVYAATPLHEARVSRLSSRPEKSWAGWPTQGDEKTGLVQQLLLPEAPPSPLSSRPEESWAFGPPKAMKKGSCSATTLNGSAALPFVISTGAQRSGEICGASGPSLGMFFDMFRQSLMGLRPS